MNTNPNTWSPEERRIAGLPEYGPLVKRSYSTFLSYAKTPEYQAAEQEHWKFVKERRFAVQVLFDYQKSYDNASSIMKSFYKSFVTQAHIQYQNACIAEQKAYRKKMSLAPPAPQKVLVEEWVTPSEHHPFVCRSCQKMFHYELHYKGNGYTCKQCC